MALYAGLVTARRPPVPGFVAHVAGLRLAGLLVCG